MAEGVVELLEVVKVYHDHAEGGLPPERPMNLPFKRLFLPYDAYYKGW